MNAPPAKGSQAGKSIASQLISERSFRYKRKTNTMKKIEFKIYSFNELRETSKRRANARLIAAIPDLFRALSDYVNEDNSLSLKHQNGIAAIKKAIYEKP